jgi:hypothetical protein
MMKIVQVPSVAVVAQVVASREVPSPAFRLANRLRVERAPRKVAVPVFPPADAAITLPGAPLGVLEGRRVFSHSGNRRVGA